MNRYLEELCTYNLPDEEEGGGMRRGGEGRREDGMK